MFNDKTWNHHESPIMRNNLANWMNRYLSPSPCRSPGSYRLPSARARRLQSHPPGWSDLYSVPLATGSFEVARDLIFIHLSILFSIIFSYVVHHFFHHFFHHCSSHFPASKNIFPQGPKKSKQSNLPLQVFLNGFGLTAAVVELLR